MAEGAAMNMKQVWGAAGGFFFVFILISLTNKPRVGTDDRRATPAPDATSAAAFSVAPEAPALGERLRGFTVIPPDGQRYAGDSLAIACRAIVATGAGWVSLAPTLNQPKGASDGVPAPTDAAIADLREAVKAAKAASLKVLLRPLVQGEDGTRSDALAPPDAAKWLTTYRDALEPILALAEAEGVEIVSIGSKLGKLQEDPGWPDLIAKARRTYKGKLTYAASPDASAGYGQVGFWKDLDYVGIDAYFPLTDAVGPQAKDLEAGWTRAAEGLESWRSGAAPDKPILLTSAGMPRLLGSAAAPAEPDLAKPEDEGLQTAAAEAFFKTVWTKPWVAGVFWHTWSGFANRQNPYALDGHPALEIVKTHFSTGN